MILGLPLMKRSGVSAWRTRPQGPGDSWDILWTVDGEEMAGLSIGDLAIRRGQVVFMDRLADLPNPMTLEGRGTFFQIASMEGRSRRVEVFCRFASFDAVDLHPMEERFRALARDPAAAYGARVGADVSTGSASLHDAVLGRPELIDPAKKVLAKAGYDVREIEIRGGADGGLLAVSFPGLIAPDLGAGTRNPHSRTESLVVDELKALPAIVLGIIDAYSHVLMAPRSLVCLGQV